MHYTQNQKIEQVTEATLVVGVDIGSRKQYARAFDWRGVELGHVFSFMDCRDGYELFLKWIVCDTVKVPTVIIQKSQFH